MRHLGFDVETNGLFDIVNTIHSLVIIDAHTDEMWSCVSKAGFAAMLPALREKYHSIEFGLTMLHKDTGNRIIAHNGVGYDIKVIKMLCPDWEPAEVFDTMIVGKMIWPADKLIALDMPRWKRGTLPGRLIKRHSLEAWGYRLGEMKGEYAPDEGHDTKWLVWRPDMQDYCEQDVRVTVKFYLLIMKHLDGKHKDSKGFVWSKESVELEHQVAELVAEQETTGYGFNMDEAIKLAGKLKNRQDELGSELVDIFGSWWQPLDDIKSGTIPKVDRKVKMVGPMYKDITIRKFSEKTGKELKPYVGPPIAQYSTDAPHVRIKRVTYKQSSRQHLGLRLQAVHGWKPMEFGGAKGTDAKVDETTIKGIPDSIVPANIKQTILESLVVTKTLGALNVGKKNWIKLCTEDGAIHGRVDPLGTVSHRAAHFNPNLGQVSAVSKDKDDNVIMGWEGGFGWECRSLFGPITNGMEQTGTDVSGLELRVLGYYLYKYDGGAFLRRVCDPNIDIHSANGEITGLTRADTKTVTYMFLFGGGPLIVGMAVGVEDWEVAELAASPVAQQYVKFMRKLLGKKFVEPDELALAQVVRGKEIIAKFMAGIIGLKDFRKDTIAFSQLNGFVEAIDGRKLMVRKPHTAVSQLIQGGGAIVCKKWMIETRKELTERYHLTHGLDYSQMAWVHDELQFENKKGLGETIGQAAEAAIVRTGEILGIQGRLATDYKVGRNWAECH